MPTVWSKLIEDYSIESGKWLEYSLFVNDFFYYWSFLNFLWPYDHYFTVHLMYLCP